MNFSKLGSWKLSLSLSIASGTVVALSMMAIAWQHNPQAAVYDATGIYWKYLAMIGISWFVLAFLLIFLPFLIAKIVVFYKQNR